MHSPRTRLFAQGVQKFCYSHRGWLFAQGILFLGKLCLFAQGFSRYLHGGILYYENSLSRRRAPLSTQDDDNKMLGNAKNGSILMYVNSANCYKERGNGEIFGSAVSNFPLYFSIKRKKLRMPGDNKESFWYILRITLYPLSFL